MTTTSSPVQRKKVATTKRWQGADTKAAYHLDVGFGNGDQPHLSRDMVGAVVRTATTQCVTSNAKPRRH